MFCLQLVQIMLMVMLIIILIVIILFLFIKDTKLYVSAVTLAETDNHKLSKRLIKALERSIYWNEYKGKSETKTTTNEFR